MDLASRCLWIALILQAAVLPSCRCVLVRFPDQQPVYVVSGQTLVLQAEIEMPQGDRVTGVTWELEPEGKTNSGRVTKVAEYPDESSGGRATVEQNRAVLKLWNYQRADGGVYTVTVRDQRGGQGSAQRTVHEYEPVHHVSVMVNVSHAILHCTEAWGTEPVYRWLHEKAAVTEDVGRVSDDGTWLYLNNKLCGHFTCVVKNKLGHSSATYTAVQTLAAPAGRKENCSLEGTKQHEPCESDGNSTAVAVVCLMVLLLLAGGLAFLLWRRRRYGNRRERLHDSHEDAI